MSFDVELTTPACPLKDKIEKDIQTAVGQIDGVDEVNVDFTANVAAAEALEKAEGPKKKKAKKSAKKSPVKS